MRTHHTRATHTHTHTHSLTHTHTHSHTYFLTSIRDEGFRSGLLIIQRQRLRISEHIDAGQIIIIISRIVIIVIIIFTLYYLLLSYKATLADQPTRRCRSKSPKLSPQIPKT
jgi:hypothetical protein